MISLEVSYGRGDRPAPAISDNLISTQAMAKVRAEQELAAHLRVEKNRVLRTPHDSSFKIGAYREFTYSKLGIFGLHLITERAIELAPDSAHDTINIERYGELLP